MWGIPATSVLVETLLLDRRTDDDLVEAEAAIERLAAAPADEGLVIREILLLRLRDLLARAHGDAAAYAQFRDRYRNMAKTLGFEGHMAWAEAMTRRRPATALASRCRATSGPLAPAQLSLSVASVVGAPECWCRRHR